MGLKNINELPWYAQVLVFVAILVAMDVILYYYFFQPIQAEIERVSKEVDKLAQDVEKGQAAERRLAEFEREIRRDNEKLSILKAILPEEKETPEIVRKLQEMAATSDLKIKKFTPQPVVMHGFYSDWPINIEMDGSYDNLGYFFERISKFTRIINVENLNIKGVDAGSDETRRTLTANCTATTFVFAEDQRKGAN
jgi:type IV pilus assembly protein PilO